MKPGLNPLRMLIETAGIVFLACAGVIGLLPLIAPAILQGRDGVALGALLVVLLASPGIFWRFLVADRRATRQFKEEGEFGKPTVSSLSGGSFRAAIAMTALTQALGLSLTAAGAVWLYGLTNAEARIEFDRRIDRLEADTRRRFAQPVYGLRGARGVYAASTEVTRLDFRAYVESRDMASEFPGVRGFGFIQRVPRSQLAQFVAAERADFASDFSVRTSGNAPDLYVIKFIDPLSQNLPAVGFDLGFDPTRREAIDRAVSTGKPALTGRITLVQDGRNGAGFIYLVPVYRRGSDPVTVEQRRQALQGLVYAPIVAAEMMSRVVNVTEGAAHFRLLDTQTRGDNRLLFDSLAEAGGAQTARTGSPLFTTSRDLEVGGRRLSIEAHSTPAFEAAVDRSSVLVVVVGGIMLSFLLAMTVWLLAAGKMRAQSLARRMTRDLDRLAKVVQSTDNAVTLTDRDLNITWVNEGFTRISGYGLNEAVGRTPGELLSSGKADPAVLAKLKQAAAAGDACRVEVLNRRKDGTEYWIETEIQPMRSDEGAVIGFMEIGLDVTEKRLASARLQAALRENQALLNTIHQHAIVSVSDPAGKIIDVNDAFCRISGYRRDELLGQDHRLINSGAQPKAFWVDMWRTIAAGKPWRSEICNRAKDGSLYWVDSIIAPFMDAEGRIERYISICFDITPSKISEQKLSENAAFLRQVGEISNVGGWQFDVQGQTVTWSEQTCKIHEMEPDYVPSLEEALSFYLPESRAAIEAVVKRAVEEGVPWDIELPIITAKGKPVWLRTVAATETEDGKVVRLLGAAQDVTTRKKAEMALGETASLLSAVLDSASEVSVIAMGADLRISVFNKGAERMLGYRSEEVVGIATPALMHDADELQRRASRLSEEVSHPVSGCDALTEPSTLGHPRQWQYVRKDGSRFTVSLVVTAMHSPQGLLMGYLCVAHDVTDQKRYEASLVEASVRAEQASVAKSQFLANMSHEIRTPMNAILGMLALLQHTELTPLQLDYTRNTEGAARSLLGLLNDILDFSKVEAGKMALDPRSFEVDQLMRDLSVILSASVGEKAIEVLFDIDANVPTVLVGDDMRLQQILINLGGNAIKFTAQGEVVIGIRCVSRTASEAELTFSVRDSGIGIAPEHQAHIFSGFSQAEASTTRRYGGTGLGLAICQRLVGLMGGSLGLDSTPGKGSTFFFTLRMAIAEVETKLPGAGETSTAGRADSSMHVLIVDDNPVARDLMRNMVQSLGWQATLAESGEQALEFLQRRAGQAFPYQAVFVDWRMPGMDGWETIRRMRAVPGCESAPVLVMVTAHGRELLTQRPAAEQALLNGFLVKPVTAAMLAAAVHSSMQDRTLTAAPVAPTRLRLEGARLLLVEDNRVNQRVAQELLRREGALITLADNGADGVAAIQAADPQFDLVLMDLHMPVMDGFNATREVRQTLGLHDLPIIAMTANAMHSDREACLEAGMDDHVGKPFELNSLVSTITKYLRRDGMADGQGDELVAGLPIAVIEGAAAHAIQAVAAINRLGGDLELYASMLHATQREMSEMLDQIAASLVQGQREECERLIHTMKGLAGTMGMVGLANMTERIEHEMREGRAHVGGDAGMLSALRRQVAESASGITQLANDIMAHLEHQAGAPVDAALAADMPALREVVQALVRLLEDSDMAAMDAFRALRQRRDWVAQAEHAALETAMMSLDFPRALRHCRAILHDMEEV